jgi:hypothetical protein
MEWDNFHFQGKLWGMISYGKCWKIKSIPLTRTTASLTLKFKLLYAIRLVFWNHEWEGKFVVSNDFMQGVGRHVWRNVIGSASRLSGGFRFDFAAGYLLGDLQKNVLSWNTKHIWNDIFQCVLWVLNTWLWSSWNYSIERLKESHVTWS